MTEATRTVFDPFHGKNVEISDRLTDRLRGKYACGPMLENGEPEFGWRQMETAPIQHEAAAEIERLQARVKELEDGLEPVVDCYTEHGAIASAYGLHGLIERARAVLQSSGK